MELGMVGLGRMGHNMSVRLVRGGHRVCGWDHNGLAVRDVEKAGVMGADTVDQLLEKLSPPRVVWLMVPVGPPVEELLDLLAGKLKPGELVVDGGNSDYRDSERRARRLAERGLAFVDCGTSGGVWGLDNGFCLMIGGEPEPVRRLAPIFDTLAPPEGWRHVGRSGAGHFVKMVHNAIEYGMLQAYAEGFEILHGAEYGLDLTAIARLWNHGGVVRSWLLELAERALEENPQLEGIADYVEDSGMGRWAAERCIEKAIPAPVLLLALLTRFRSRQDVSYAGKMVAALRNQFGGHAVKKA